MQLLYNTVFPYLFNLKNDNLTMYKGEYTITSQITCHPLETGAATTEEVVRYDSIYTFSVLQALALCTLDL